MDPGSGSGPSNLNTFGGSMGLREMDDAYRIRHTDADADASASASDAGSTISTNPNSIFSNSNTVRFGNVLSLEDFKGCPCPLDDIVEHEHPRDDRSTSPRSVRVNQSSRAASPDNRDDDLDDDLDLVLSNPPEYDPKRFSFVGMDDEDEDTMLQLAMLASINDLSGTTNRSNSQSGDGDGGQSGGNQNTAQLTDFDNERDYRGPTGISARARGKQPLFMPPNR